MNSTPQKYHSGKSSEVSVYFNIKQTGTIKNHNGDQEVFSYDPWGKRRDFEDWTKPYNGEFRLFDRGYTGHEMLDQFGIINMPVRSSKNEGGNGRIYDPVVARFFSPDPFVQAPSSTQNYNRYSYVMNNPLKYTDPTGNFFLGTALTFVIDGWSTVFNGGINGNRQIRNNAWRNFDPTAPWSKTNKAYKIDMGFFKLDNSRHHIRQLFDFGLRFTWEYAQTNLGKTISHIRNITGNVDDVSYYRGVTLVNRDDPNQLPWGFSLGSYINSNRVAANPYSDRLFRHEFGHTLQSKLLGPLYLGHVGIPSAIGMELEEIDRINHDHNDEWYEIQANRMALRYFGNKHSDVLNFSAWDRNFTPTSYNLTWYWFFANPGPMSWLLFF